MNQTRVMLMTRLMLKYSVTITYNIKLELKYGMNQGHKKLNI